MEKTNRGSVASEERRNDFSQIVRKGKAVSAAREAGYELISEDRLGDLLSDLSDMGYITVLNVSDGNEYQMGDNAILDAAEKGMEILRG